MKIGLTLSGGGFRATVFHLGVLARLAEENRLEDISFLSTVSGGSLCGALVFAQNGMQWPSSAYFIEKIIPQARKLLTTYDLEQNIIWRVLRNPLHIFETRGADLGALIGSRWRLRGKLCELPPHPRWLINATCYETGRNWHFERFLMGDRIFGYSFDPEVPLRDAVASSCGFPGLIGALTLKTHKATWFKFVDPTMIGSADEIQLRQSKTIPTQPLFPQLHLWDGGVFDNMGLEGVMDGINGWHHGIDFLIASDANSPVKNETYRMGMNAMMRIIVGIMMEQVLTLRKHQVAERTQNHGDRGTFVSITSSAKRILAGLDQPEVVEQICSQCLSEEQALLAADTATNLRRFSTEQFDNVFRHGFEVTNCMLFASYPKQFDHIDYAKSKSQKEMRQV
ncbi:MAG: patatin-like phospholipase family protein [Chloroflexi bacterium]|nr:patatin-like phospholipase family protein [Chloroflexota bacterium]